MRFATGRFKLGERVSFLIDLTDVQTAHPYAPVPVVIKRSRTSLLEVKSLRITCRLVSAVSPSIRMKVIPSLSKWL